MLLKVIVSVSAMAAADSAPAVDPAPASEPVEETKVDEKPVKVTREKKAKAPLVKKTKEVKAPKPPKAPASHPSYLLVSSTSIFSAERNRLLGESHGVIFCEDSWRSWSRCSMSVMLS